MSGHTFDEMSRRGLQNGEPVDVMGSHLAEALKLSIKKFGANKPVCVSIVVQPVEVLEQPQPTQDFSSNEIESAPEDEDDEYGVAYLLCDEEEKPLAVQIDICTMSPVDFSDQPNEGESAKGKSKH